MGGAPGMSAPGTQAPPGVAAAPAQGTRPQGLPASFQGPVNMPNINFSAPVIRLGTGATKAAPVTGQADRGQSDSRSGRPGLGMERGQTQEQQRTALRDSIQSLAQPTKEETVRTIFVAGITEGCGGDAGIERILQTAGRLRRWDRAIDADGKECSFGFAQYDDPESLHTAVEVLKDIDIPVKKQPPGGVKREIKEESDIKKEDGDEDKKEDANDEKDDEPQVEKKKLLVFVDDNSLNYLESWSSKRGDNPEGDQARLDNARAALKSAIHGLFYPPKQVKHEDLDGDTQMHETGQAGENVEVVNIPLAQADDELSDIPAEMREMVAKEIASFRDRSIRRDMERLKREEEMEAAERARNGAARPSRLASPSPTGPSGGSNNVPLGPRGVGVTGAPSGPKGSQMPRDYQRDVKFVNGSGLNGASSGSAYISREDEDDSASDSELENRRQEKKKLEQEKMYLDQERRWLNRERSRTAAVEREKERDEADKGKALQDKEKMAAKLKNWNDDEEAKKRVHEYYADRSAWIRTRAAFRAREAAQDEEDRKAEERENERLGIAKEQARGAAASFLDKASEEISAGLPDHRAAPQPFKLSLGAAAQKAHKAAAPRRTVAEVEGLLEDEEDEGKAKRRELIPIKYDPADRGVGLSDEEREQAIKDLAAEIPTSKEGLWDWNVKWEYVDEGVIQEKLKPFVERKIMEYLGVQEQTIVEVVEEHIRKRGAAQELVEALEGVSFTTLILIMNSLLTMIRRLMRRLRC